MCKNPAPHFLRGFPGKRPRVIGHRGSCGNAPENTLGSFELAVKEGADILEMDVRRTADNEVVVMHDPLVDRTTDGTGEVATKTLAELRALDAGYRFTPDGGKTYPFRGRGISIPTFAEVLDAFPSTPMNVEIKTNDPVLVEKFLALLDRYGRFQDVTVVLIAAEADKLKKRVLSLEPRAVTGHSYWEVIRFLTLSRLGLSFLFRPTGPALQVPERKKWIQIVTPDFVQAAHRRGMEVHVWTINEEPDMRRYLAMGVDAIFTDFPGRLRKVVDSQVWPPTGINR